MLQITLTRLTVQESYCWFEILGSESKFLWMRDTWKTREVGREMTRKSKQTIHNTNRSKWEDKQKDRPAQITAQPNRAYEWTSGRSQAPRGLGSNSSFLKKQKIKFKKLQNTDSCKKTLEYDGEWTRVKLEERAVKRAETSPTNTKNSRELVGRNQNGQNNRKQKSKESTHMITCIHRQVPTSPKRGRVWSPLGWTAKTCQALSA